jgi:hypothetical protein
VTIVEFVRFRTLPCQQDALQAARTAAMSDLGGVPGFRAAYLVSLEHDEWLDVIVWDGPHLPPDRGGRAQAYTGLMSEILGEELGVVIDGPEPHG